MPTMDLNTSSWVQYTSITVSFSTRHILAVGMEKTKPINHIYHLHTDANLYLTYLIYDMRRVACVCTDTAITARRLSPASAGQTRLERPPSLQTRSSQCLKSNAGQTLNLQHLEDQLKQTSLSPLSHVCLSVLPHSPPVFLDDNLRNSLLLD